MTTIVFIQPDGSELKVPGRIGDSVMQSAVNAQVPGILGDCGGNCSCATCHAYIGDAWKDRLPVPAAHEADLLACVAHQQSSSRLTCEIIITPELDGLQLYLPPSD
jgi:ferredoxin, 2Fe-2S